MSTEAFQRSIARRPWAASAVYTAVILVCIAAIIAAVVDLLNRREELNAANEVLGRLQGQSAGSLRVAGAQSARSGSPLLEGSTVTVAGADLLQRVSKAITKVGGNILSSQVDLQGTQAKNGFIGVIVSCEVDQPALQRLLYDLEAGMPFLFVSQLVVQAPIATTATQEGRMRILVAVSGQWQGTQ